MVSVHTTVTAVDICDPNPAAIILVSATSNEPDDYVAPCEHDGMGGNNCDTEDGQTIHDIQEFTIGTPDVDGKLRAERMKHGTGRVYTLTYQATDYSGNFADAAALVTVPINKPGWPPEPVDEQVDEPDGNNNSMVSWGAVQGAQSYNVVRGNLANLRVEGSDVNLGPVVCIADGITDTSTSGHLDAAIPAPGQVFFYVVGYSDGEVNSGYGTVTASRPRVVRPGNGDCLSGE
jgi:hypothetical protein